MIKRFSLIALSTLFALLVNSQTVDWSTDPGLQQPLYNLSDIEGVSNTLANDTYVLNSDQTATQQLDSIIYYQYDEVSEAWNTKSYKLSVFYDQNFNDTLILQSTWNDEKSDWAVRAKEIKRYNENKQLLRREFHLISKTGNLTEYTYNDNGNLIETTESYLNSGEWRYKSKNVCSYNSENVIQADTLFHRFTFSGTPVWRKVSITSFYYNTEGRLSADTTLARPWVTGDNFGDWELSGNTEIDKAVNENTTETIFERWNSESSAFKPYKKECILFQNEDKDISARINFEWNTEFDVWDTTNMIGYSYGDDDFIMNYEKRTWGDSPTKVLEVLDYDYTLENNELVHPSSALGANPTIAFHHKINSKQSLRYDLSTHETEQFRETIYYYSKIKYDPTTSVDKVSLIKVELYPNPASEFIAISFPDSYHKALFELFDVNGKKMLSKAVTSGDNINISKLKKGFYVYSIQVDAEKLVGKLLVE